MKRVGGKAKGNGFEREICTLLSKWWTEEERDDIFWRSTISGGRATRRAKSGKRTEGQYGDVQAVDPIGLPLTRLLTIEIKRGYKNASFGDLLDLGPKKKTIWHDWVEQARRESEQAKSFAWLLIVKRDFRQTVVVGPVGLDVRLTEKNDSGLASRAFPMFRIGFRVGKSILRLFATPLSEFLRCVSPVVVEEVYDDWEDETS